MKTKAIEELIRFHDSRCDQQSVCDSSAEARAELQALKEQLAAKDALLKHIKDILIGRGFTDPLVQEIQAHFINQESEQE